MKYVRYYFTFKNGLKEDYLIEIEPHKIEEYKNGLKEVNSVIYNSMMTGKSGVIKLKTEYGLAHIRTDDIVSSLVTGFLEL